METKGEFTETAPPPLTEEFSEKSIWNGHETVFYASDETDESLEFKVHRVDSDLNNIQDYIEDSSPTKCEDPKVETALAAITATCSSFTSDEVKLQPENNNNVKGQSKQVAKLSCDNEANKHVHLEMDKQQPHAIVNTVCPYGYNREINRARIESADGIKLDSDLIGVNRGISTENATTPALLALPEIKIEVLDDSCDEAVVEEDTEVALFNRALLQASLERRR